MVAFTAHTCAVAQAVRTDSTAPLPEISANVAPAVRAQMKSARDIALRHPLAASRVGSFGMILHAYDELAAAEACYARAGSLDTKSPQWPYLQGIAAFVQGRAEDALRHLGRALQRDPQDVTILLRIAEYQHSLGDTVEAKISAEKALKLVPDTPAALFRLGRLTLEEGSSAEALELLQRVDELAPNHRETQYGLSLAYRRLGKTEEANHHQRLYQTLPARRSNWPDPYLEAVALKRSALPQTFLETGLEEERRGDLSAAIVAYKRALELDPEFAQAHINLLNAYSKQGDRALVTEHYEQALQLTPKSYELHYNYGVHLLNAGSLAEAEKALRTACELHPNSPASFQNLGHVLEMLGRNDEAVAIYKHVLTLEPGFRLSHLHLGRWYLRAGQESRATFHLKKSLELKDQDEAKFTYLVANAYYQVGNKTEAREYAKRAYELARKWQQDRLAGQIEQALKLLAE